MGELTELVDRLTLAEKCALVAGADWWRTPVVARPEEGWRIPAIKMTDGPNGARGEQTAPNGTPGVVVPVGIAQGATWDPELIGQVGELLGREARRRSAHVLLAPSVNLHRTPIGGRTFEYYSEDPELTAALAVAYVRGVQSTGVAATVKHFVANDTEVDRFTVDVAVDERVLRELYLRPFEDCVATGAWAVMSSYNRVAGEHAAANRRLLTDVLRTEWGFDGVVMSDWFGTHHTAESALAGLSIEMPGPPKYYGAALADAVGRGDVPLEAVDRLVADVLRLAERVRADERSADAAEQSVDDPSERAFVRAVAIAGTVLAKNDGLLPLDAGMRIAVVGPNAAQSRTQGGGSSMLRPLHQTSILEALAGRFGEHLTHAPGVRIDKYTPLADDGRWVGPGGTPGIEISFYNSKGPDGAPVYRAQSDGLVRFFGSLPEGVTTPCFMTLRGEYVPAVDGPHVLGLITGGRPASSFDGVAITRAGEHLPSGDSFYGIGSAEQFVTIEAAAGVPLPFELDLVLGAPYAVCRVGVRPPATTDEFAHAVAVAADADVAVVVVGTNDEWESEGADRTTLALPGRQDELVAAVAAANPRTVVVVNAGSPVTMPWLADVAAVVIPFFGGMELGEAVADVLTGAADPGGRLPTTYPRGLDDLPAMIHYAPVDGVQTYAEGHAIGYRAFDAGLVAGDPLFPFGHGLSYGTAEWGTAEVEQVGDAFVVHLSVTATGARPATVVLQGYVAPVDAPVAREVKALKAFAKVVVPAGATTGVRLEFGPRAFRRWCADRSAWVVDPGEYDLVIGASAADVRSVVRVTRP